MKGLNSLVLVALMDLRMDDYEDDADGYLRNQLISSRYKTSLFRLHSRIGIETRRNEAG